MPKFTNKKNAADIFQLKHEHVGDFYDSTPASYDSTPISDDGRADPFNSLDPINGLDAFNSASGPAAPAIASFSPDTGVLDDGITNANVLTLAGTAPASSTVNVYDGVSLLDTVTVDGNGAWSCTTGTLSNGPHSFTATDTLSGTTSSASSALNVTVDLDSLDGRAPILSNASGETTGTTPTTSSSEGSSFTTTSLQSTAWLNVTVASFSPDTGILDDGIIITNPAVLTLAGTAAASSTVNVYDGATLLDRATVDGSGTWSYTTGTLSNGPHSFTATDTAIGYH